MREATAAACREALDGMADMAVPQAWALRDEYRDLWPSTVVRNLGALATTPRGAELVARQLSVHQNNVSVVRNAAGIALGMKPSHPYSVATAGQ